MVAVQNLEGEIIQLVTHSSSFSSESCYLENLKTYAVFYTRPSIPLTPGNSPACPCVKTVLFPGPKSPKIK
jgi:hypothetical protein